MRSLANQCNAMTGELSGLLDRERKHMTPRLDMDAAENGMRAFLGRLRQLIVAELGQLLGFLWRSHPYHAASIARQRHENARALRGMKLGRHMIVRPRMRDVECQSCPV